MERDKEASDASSLGSQDLKPMFSDSQMRKLRFAVVAMGAILLMGFALVIGRIIYLVNRTPATTEASSTSTQVPVAAAAIAPEAKLSLPAGAVVRNLSLSGNRLAVQFETPVGAGIAIIDLQSGKTVQRIDITPGPR